MGKSKEPAADKFQIVTDKILGLLEQGTKPWTKPWVQSGMAYQSVEGHVYQGINPLLCAVDSMAQGYTSPLFAGFKTGQSKGWKLKKGSKSTWITYAAKVGEGEDEFFLKRWYNVFNVECWDDSESDIKIQALIPQTFDTQPIAELDKLVESHKPKIKPSEMAFYSSSSDEIGMPNINRFTSSEGYYATLVHEMSHWTGHSSRLDRKLANKFGSNAYAFEELIAELSAAFVCNNFGLESEIENHASYLDNWLKVLKSDNTAFVKAASEAQKAAKFLLKE